MNAESETNGRNEVTTQQLIDAVREATKHIDVLVRDRMEDWQTMSYIDAEALLGELERVAAAEYRKLGGEV